jgi:membrane fusion protein (multidrug efflux system)
MIRSTLLAAAVLLITVVLLTGCSESNTSGESEDGRRVSVQTAVVQTGSITEYLEVAGTTAPRERAKLGAKVDGTISEITVDEGDEIRKGQLLLSLDPVDFQLEIDRAAAALKTAQAELEQAQEDYELKGFDWKRISSLYERRVIAKHRYDGMKASYHMAKAAVDAARAQVEQRKAELGLAEKRYADSRVLAPFDAVVTKKMLHAGEISSVYGYNWEALEVMDLSYIKIECDIAEKWLTRISPGMSTLIKVDAFPGEKFQGTITTMTPLVDPQQRTFKVKIVIPNGNNKFTAGMFARIKIALENRQGTIIVPIDDILQTPDGHFIFLVQDGKARWRQIELGIVEEKKAEVVSGLQPGDVVVTAGSHGLQDGTPVEVGTP